MLRHREKGKHARRKRSGARSMNKLEAAGGLGIRRDAEGRLHLEWRETDWLGPMALRFEPGADEDAAPGGTGFEGSDDLGTFRGLALASAGLFLPVEASVRAYTDSPLLVFRLEAKAALSALSTGSFARVSVAWPAFSPGARAPGGIPAGTRSYGHQFTEFALPVSGDDTCCGYTFAGHRPPVVEPLLLIAPDLRTLLLAPLDGFHEQAIAVPKDESEAALGVRCGWQGDLDEVPAGFATEMLLLAAAGPRAALDALGALLLRRHGTKRPSRYADDGVGKLSYWTDNGSVYYYRTEPGEDYATTLERTIATLQESRVPVAAVQIDSWFYPHETLRPVSTEGAPVVPPTGMLRWEPREDLFPEGFVRLRQRLGGLPIIFHSRHFSSQSPYFEEQAAWRDGGYAHPEDPALYELLLEQAAGWGAISYEQDWMVESFLGVRGLRAAPGRARAWQEGMDRAAAERGMTLQWCMASPADFLQTVTLSSVTSIRTSGDYRYLFDNGLNWVWFLHGNAFARALGLHPYKDVFLTHGETGLGPGERYPEAESLLAALSAGPVGIGDRRGHTDRALVLRTCREDGVLVKPDLPIAAIDRCFRANAFLEQEPLVGETISVHPAGRWVYVAAFNACRAKQPLRATLPFSDLGAVAPAGPVVAYDWRTRRFAQLEAGGALALDLAWQDFSYTVLCPVLQRGLVLFGDTSKYATAGDRRLARITETEEGLRFDVLGARGETVCIEGCAPRAPSARARAPGETIAAEVQHEPGGRFAVRLRLGAAGHARVTLTS
jgi:hypothetical protein